MEAFQYKIGFVESNSTLAKMCNNTQLNGSEFARFYLKNILNKNKFEDFIFLGVNIVVIILMIIYHH